MDNKIIELENFKLELFNLNKSDHLRLIRQFDLDPVAKKYLFPYYSSFYDVIDKHIERDNIFDNFYVVYHDNKAIGYLEIKDTKDVSINSALIKSERGKGYGSKCLKELSKYLLDNYEDNVNSVNTITRNENIAGLDSAKKAGFTYKESKNGFTTYTKTR